MDSGSRPKPVMPDSMRLLSRIMMFVMLLAFS